MATPNDAALDTRLTHLRQADPAAFLEALFKAFYAPLGAVAYRVVPDRAAVEDILQDVFLRVWQGLATLPAIDSHRAYLTRMALNAAVRYQQRAQRHVAWDEAPPASAPVAPDALAQLHATETTAAVAAALAHLPPQCRVVFELSRYEEMSYQQIAEALEISPKTVENQMGKALRILRRELAGVLKNLYGLLLYLLALRALSAGGGPARPAPAAIFGGRVGVGAPWRIRTVPGPVLFPRLPA
ncbi:RNA polymerase sigma-70 factor [Hymenobacter nivis]|uniref:RNA polymerase sigma-70 factor n=1 Tax=Hymenobacter nivis TaxID=1850093 RepID=A0A2Z3GJE2_9BACT|nr:RNA polymerase sigma-70 factor [Hymenobacter nivis]AWM31787.1 RNA polymerase sigma-70 factor [Hymenobacter nivis]